MAAPFTTSGTPSTSTTTPQQPTRTAAAASEPTGHATPAAPIVLDHVREIVTDPEFTADQRERWGFSGEAIGESGRRAPHTLWRQGSVRIISTPAEPGAADLCAGLSPSDYARRHGDGIVDIALATPNLATVYTRAVANGARVLRAAASDPVPTITIAGPDRDLIHTIVQREPDAGHTYVPQIGTVSLAEAERPRGFTHIDHFALVCQRDGGLDRTADFYCQVLGFARVFDHTIAVGPARMRSVVVSSGSGVVLTLVAPSGPRGGQLDDFLRDSNGPGVQHIALHTENIVATVRSLRERLVDFAPTPHAYYRDLAADPARVPHTHTVGDLEETHVLADQDEFGEMLQIFARSTHEYATFFLEIIQRAGAKSFGVNNIERLFRSRAADDAARSAVTR